MRLAAFLCLKIRGNRRRAILALGQQDVEVTAIRPNSKATVLGASSDHLLLDVTDVHLEVGSEVRFDLGYGALLRAMTSPFVEKVYLSSSQTSLSEGTL